MRPIQYQIGIDTFERAEANLTKEEIIAVCKFNIDKKNIIKDFLNYIIRNSEINNTPEYFNFVENIIHFEDCKNRYFVNYSLVRLSTLLKES